MNIAIIGRRHPSVKQVQVLSKIMAKFGTEATIITGCANGIDAVALRIAKELGMKTIGCIPWTSFKLGIQKYCDDIVDLSKVDEVLRQEAYESVRKHHPAKGGSQMGFLLHARNYLIIHKAERVIAFPSKEDYGGTAQGIRLAKAMGIPFKAIDEDGKDIEVI